MQMHKCIFGCIAFYALAIHFHVFRNKSESAQERAKLYAFE